MNVKNTDPKANQKLKECSEDNQELVLNYLSSGKDVIPYEMITRFDYLNISPEEGIFLYLTTFTQV